MNSSLNKHQYEHSSVFTTSMSRMAGVLKLSYLPKNAELEKFDLFRINDIWKKTLWCSNAMKTFFAYWFWCETRLESFVNKRIVSK